MPTITYKRVPYPENITDPRKPDYWIEVDGKRLGYVIHIAAGRSSGTWTHWSAYRLDGSKVGSYAYHTFKKLKADIEAWHLHTLIGAPA